MSKSDKHSQTLTSESTKSNSETIADEQSISRLMQAVGSRENMPETMKGNWEKHFRDELSLTIKRRRTTRVAIASLCASIVFACILLIPTAGNVPIFEPVVVKQSMGKSKLLFPSGSQVVANRGVSLPNGTVVTTHPGNSVALDYRGFDLRLNENTEIIILKNGIEMKSGEIYISNHSISTNTGLSNITVHTPFGKISDIGTQFIVKLDHQRMVSTVREGIILIDTGERQTSAEASSTRSAQVSVDRNKQINISKAPKDTEHWEWIYSVTPEFLIEGKTVFEFLRWSVQESGMKLEFASDGAQAYAQATVLHGSMSGLSPEAALSPILATTHLDAAIKDNSLTVSLKH